MITTNSNSSIFGQGYNHSYEPIHVATNEVDAVEIIPLFTYDESVPVIRLRLKFGDTFQDAPAFDLQIIGIPAIQRLLYVEANANSSNSVMEIDKDQSIELAEIGGRLFITIRTLINLSVAPQTYTWHPVSYAFVVSDDRRGEIFGDISSKLAVLLKTVH